MKLEEAKSLCDQISETVTNYFVGENFLIHKILATWESTVEKYVPVCEDGYHVEGYECVKDPVVCEDGYTEFEGECIPVLCIPGYELIDGECVEIQPLVCEDGYSEVDGECVKDEDTCPEGFEPIPGGCKEITKTGCKASVNVGAVLIPTIILGFILLIIRKRQVHVSS